MVEAEPLVWRPLPLPGDDMVILFWSRGYENRVIPLYAPTHTGRDKKRLGGDNWRRVMRMELVVRAVDVLFEFFWWTSPDAFRREARV